MLWQRILTGVVLAPLFLAGVFLGKGWPFALLIGLVSLLCAGEFVRMLLPPGRDRVTVAALTLLAYLATAFLSPDLALPGLLLVCAYAAFHFLPQGVDAGERARRAAFGVLCVLWAGGFPALYPRILGMPRGEHWVVLGLIAGAAGDTAAYFTGRAIGKRPLMPSVSPKKTVEGAAGGLLASILLPVAYARFFLPDVPPWYIGAASAAMGATGQLGDLLESLLKRAGGVKDSGSFLPGHGGMLDRADALISAAPVLYLAAALGGRFGSGS